MGSRNYGVDAAMLIDNIRRSPTATIRHSLRELLGIEVVERM